MLSCRDVNHSCFAPHMLCIYSLTPAKNLATCRNGIHLAICRDFECNNNLFKCPVNYCVPWEYVCNSRWDCPFGHDEHEVCSLSKRCTSRYKCLQTSSICIHISSVCDGILNCQLGDDEFMCELKDTFCPQACLCQSYALVCSHSNLHLVNFNSPYVSVVLFKITFSSIPATNIRFEKVLNLELIQLKISDVCGLKMSPDIRRLVITLNPIELIQTNCITKKQELAAILLNSNAIRTIREEAFVDLPTLKKLNLSQNFLISFPKCALVQVNNLVLLSLRVNSLSNIKQNAFSEIFPVVIEFSAHQFCCFVHSGSKCNVTDSKPWYESCENILQNKALNVLFAAMPCCLLVLTMLSVFCLSYMRKYGQQFTILALTASLLKVFWVLYQSVVWIADLYFSETIAIASVIWRSHIMCFVASSSALAFYFMEPGSISFLSFARFMVTAHPFTSKFKNVKFCLKCVQILCSCAFGSLGVVTGLLLSYMKKFPTNLCVIFVDPEKLGIHSKIMISFMTFFQVSLAVTTSVTNILVVQNVEESSKDLTKKTMRKAIVIQAVVVLLSHSVCWTSTSVAFVTLAFLDQYPVEMVTWILGAVVPVNSLTTAVIFIVTSLRKTTSK